MCVRGPAGAAFAARVLELDVEKHGRRFVLIEFWLSVIVSGALAVTVGATAVVRGSGIAPGVVGVVFFVGVAINSVAAARWVARDSGRGATSRVSVVDVCVFAVATLSPGALAVALRRP
jgi:hypothetical protein